MYSPDGPSEYSPESPSEYSPESPSEYSPESPSGKHSWFGLFLAYKIIVFGLALVGLTTFARIWPMSFSHFTGLLVQWDAKHILRVAREGYLAGEPSIQVFPLFPMMIRAFHFVLPGWDISAWLAAQVCSFFAFYYFYRLARLELERPEARVALALFALFPTAYFLSVPYTESAFCATTFATVYYLRKKQFPAAALAAMLATLSRTTGILMAGAVVVHAAQELGYLPAWLAGKAPSRRLPWRAALPYAAVVAAICAGFGVYLVMNQVLYGDWAYFLPHQAKHWGVHTSWPFKGAIEALKAWSSRSPDQQMAIIILELGFTGAALAFLPAVLRRRNLLDFTYMGLSLLLLVCLDFWLSRPRYVLPLYPMYIVAAPWFARSPFRLSLYALASAGLFGIYWATYLKAQWAF